MSPPRSTFYLMAAASLALSALSPHSLQAETAGITVAQAMSDLQGK